MIWFNNVAFPGPKNLGRCQVWPGRCQLTVDGFHGDRQTIFSTLSVCHLNAGPRGLCKPGQLEALEDFLLGEGLALDVTVVSETWLKPIDYLAMLFQVLHLWALVVKLLDKVVESECTCGRAVVYSHLVP